MANAQFSGGCKLAFYDRSCNNEFLQRTNATNKGIYESFANEAAGLIFAQTDCKIDNIFILFKEYKVSRSLLNKNRPIHTFPRIRDIVRATIRICFILLRFITIERINAVRYNARYTDAASSPPKLHRFFRSDSHDQPGYFDNSLFCERVTRKRSKACQ